MKLNIVALVAGLSLTVSATALPEGGVLGEYSFLYLNDTDLQAHTS